MTITQTPTHKEEATSRSSLISHVFLTRFPKREKQGEQNTDDSAQTRSFSGDTFLQKKQSEAHDNNSDAYSQGRGVRMITFRPQTTLSYRIIKASSTDNNSDAYSQGRGAYQHPHLFNNGAKHNPVQQARAIPLFMPLAVQVSQLCWHRILMNLRGSHSRPTLALQSLLHLNTLIL